MTTETNKLKHLNSILIKALRESKTEITKLKQESEINKTKIKQLRDENEKLKAENVSLKNHQTSKVDLEKVKKEIENHDSIQENFKKEKSENILNPSYNNQEGHTTGDNKPSDFQNLTPKDQKYDICEYCQKTFSSLMTLNKHIKNIHRKKNVGLLKKPNNTGFLKTHKCEFCGNFFSTRGTLKQHKNIHKKDKLFKCILCQKSFVAESRLTRHKREVHEGKTEKKCGFCGKKFSRGDALKVHIYTVHEGHRDYKCEYCDKSFKQRSSLNGHYKRLH